jgi:hypothetical protein
VFLLDNVFVSTDSARPDRLRYHCTAPHIDHVKPLSSISGLRENMVCSARTVSIRRTGGRLGGCTDSLPLVNAKRSKLKPLDCTTQLLMNRQALGIHHERSPVQTLHHNTTTLCLALQCQHYQPLIPSACRLYTLTVQTLLQ